MAKPKILFLCTGNSCRSQMAEGWTRALKADQLEAYSAGIQPKGVDPRAIQVMAEAGIDISGQSSKDIDSLGNLEFEYVVTLCDNARESCPFFPAKTKRVHQGFEDPPLLAAGAGSEEEALIPYRRVRDAIRAFVESLPEALD
jgi:arsenate reductase